MIPDLTTLEPIVGTPSATAKILLSRYGYTCTLLTLAPGAVAPRRSAREAEEHLVVVLSGQATISSGGINTILNSESALLLPDGREHTLAASLAGEVRLLRIETPARQPTPATLELVTLARPPPPTA